MTDTEVRIMLNGLKRISELKGVLPINDRQIIRDAYFWIKNKSEEPPAPQMVCTFSQNGDHKWYRAAEDARELLREQKPVATDTNVLGDWISVKDRLPGNEWVLVSLINKRTGHRWQIPIVAECSTGTWLFYCPDDDINNKVEVTHWMPLPEPPKEVSGDEQG